MMDVVIVGAGFAGATVARILAENGFNITIIEKRDHIGGNMYDYMDESKSFIHQYGPHIFHTNLDEVYNFLSRYSDFFPYQHKVIGNIKNKLVPIPFSLKTLEMLFNENDAKRIKEMLIDTFGVNSKISIIELRKHENIEIRNLADYVYENVFLNYTKKQWGLLPEELDKSVTERIPVYISYDERYFQDKIQMMPLYGYTNLFKVMLDHPKIKVKLNFDATEVVTPNSENGSIYINNEEFKGILIYTGLIDEFFKYKYGRLPYRSLNFEFQSINKPFFQQSAVVNFPNDHNYTRISEFKRFTVHDAQGDMSTIAYEYPCEYTGTNIPYYPIPQTHNEERYSLYKKEAEKIENLYLVGRLAEYKYYNMDLVIKSSMEIAQLIINNMRNSL